MVTPLELEVLEEVESGRVRVTVRDASTKEFVPKVQVKVIGSDNAGFISGETDLRGVFVAEGVKGEAAAVARKGAGQYAFYRGKTVLGPAPKAGIPPTPPSAGTEKKEVNQSLDENLKSLNNSNQLRNIDRLEKRYQAPAPGVKGGAAAGGFR